MTLGAHARSTLGRLIRRLQAQAGATLASPGVDEVHDLRVAIRRLSQALRHFSALFAESQARRMRRSLKPLLDAAAVVRDLDVDSELLVECGLSERHRLLAAMRQERTRRALAVSGHLYLLGAEQIPESWLAGLGALGPDERDAATVARAELPALAADFFKAGRKAAFRSSGPARLHAFRLAAKRFRYTLELYRPFYGPALDARIGAVREIQSLLGARQDCAVTAARLHAAASPDGAMSAVLAAIERRGAQLEDDFRRCWRTRFDAPGADRAWQSYLARRAPAPRPRKPIE